MLSSFNSQWWRGSLKGLFLGDRFMVRRIFLLKKREREKSNSFRKSQPLLPKRKHKFQQASWQGGDGHLLFLSNSASSMETLLQSFWSSLFLHREYFHSQQYDLHQDWYMYHCIYSLISVNKPSFCLPWETVSLWISHVHWKKSV